MSAQVFWLILFVEFRVLTYIPSLLNSYYQSVLNFITFSSAFWGKILLFSFHLLLWRMVFTYILMLSCRCNLAMYSFWLFCIIINLFSEWYGFLTFCLGFFFFRMCIHKWASPNEFWWGLNESSKLIYKESFAISCLSTEQQILSFSISQALLILFKSFFF